MDCVLPRAFEHYNPREAGEVQQRGESPGNYRMQSDFQDTKQLTCDLNVSQGLRECKMQAQNASIYGLWWFERLGRR